MSALLTATARTLTLLLLLLAVSCDHGDQNRKTVRRWLLCMECVAGELDSVLALGNRAVPILKLALGGLAPDDSASAAARYTAEFNDLARWARGRPGPEKPSVPDSAAYVSGYLTNLFESYQARAALGLDSLGTPQAKNALTDFWNTDSLRLRPRARRLVETLVKKGRTVDTLVK